MSTWDVLPSTVNLCVSFIRVNTESNQASLALEGNYISDTYKEIKLNRKEMNKNRKATSVIIIIISLLLLRWDFKAKID